MKLLPTRRTIFVVVLFSVFCVALIASGGSRFHGNKDVLHDLEVFAKVVEKIHSCYVDEVNTHELINEAIEKMLYDLDPHSQFLSGLQYEDLLVSTQGEFGGLGIYILYRDGFPTVVAPIEGTPAAATGIRSGDQIIRIGDESTEGWTSERAVKLLRGAPGTDVTFTVNRPGLEEQIEYTITREIIQIKSVPYYGMFGDYGYVKVRNFSRQTRDELKDAVQALEAEGMKGLVIDLRSNPGGLLQAATAVSELFLGRDRLIVYTKGRLSNSNQKYYSRSSKFHNGYPIVIMLNLYSASASEIFAGAMQDWDAAFVIGQTSFGKGTVQTVYELSDSEAVKLTTAMYYTPSGRNINNDHRERSSTDTELAGTGSDTTSGSEAALEEKPIFYTAKGRAVYGGGGITPDLELEPETYSDLQLQLERKGLIFSFAVEYSNDNEIENDFKVTDEILKSFKAFLIKREFELDEEEFVREENLDYIKLAIAREIISSNFGRTAMYRVVLEHEKEFQKVLSILRKAPTLEDLFAYAEEQKSLKEARVE